MTGEKLRSLVVLLLFSLMIWTGSGREARSDPDVYSFGVPPWQRGQSVDDIRRLYRPLLDHLSGIIGARITLVSARSYDDMIDYFVNGRVHFGTISPVPYVTAQARNPGIRMLVTELSWSEDHRDKVDSYRGYFVTLKNRDDINGIADLKGLNFAFVTDKSSSGFTYPVAILKARGIDYQNFFKSFVFVGSHPRVTDAIAEGSVDAGATWNFNLTQAIDKHGDIFKVINEITIPNLGIAVHPSMSIAIQDKIRQALLTIDPGLLAGLPTAGYVERPDSFYDPVRVVAGLRKE